MVSYFRVPALLAGPVVAFGLVAAAPASEAATKIQRVTSPGGIEAWLVEDHAVPVIAVNFAFQGGSRSDPQGKEGLANVLSTLLDEGAGDLDSAAFQQREEELSVKLSYSDSRDTFFGEFKTLSANRDEGFELLRLSISAPRFDAEAVERMKTQAIASLRRSARDPNTIAGELWSRNAFPGHPYGRPANGTEASVATLTPADVRDFHRALFTRDLLKVAVVGDIDAATLGPILDKVFGALPAKTGLAPVANIKPTTGKTITEALPIPQTVIRFGGVGLLRDDPDFIPAYVMNHILGGGSFSSRLYTEVREKRGLAYSVYTALSPLDHAGVFIGAVATRADRAEESLDVIRAEIKRMATEGPTADELAKAKQYLTGSYALRFDTSDNTANQLLGMQIDNLGIDYIEKRNGLIEAVTLEDVMRTAKRILSEGMLVVSIGPTKS